MTDIAADPNEKKRDTPFVKRGNDVFMQSSGVYWLFLVLALVYTVLLFVQWVTVLNVNVTHTYFSNPGAPGTLLSYRNAWQGVVLKLLSTRILFTLSVLALVVFRRSYAWNVFWIVVMILLFLIQMVAWTALTAEYANHSTDGNRYGLAADPWFCCAPTRHANVNNGCVNALPCGEPVPPTFNAHDLRPNEPFVALYWVNFVLVLLDVVWLVWFLLMWNAKAENFRFDRNTVGYSEQEDEEGGEKQDDDTLLMAELHTPLAAEVVRVGHGLKKRNNNK